MSIKASTLGRIEHVQRIVATSPPEAFDEIEVYACFLDEVSERPLEPTGWRCISRLNIWPHPLKYSGRDTYWLYLKTVHIKSDYRRHLDKEVLDNCYGGQSVTMWGGGSHVGNGLIAVKYPKLLNCLTDVANAFTLALEKGWELPEEVKERKISCG